MLYINKFPKLHDFLQTSITFALVCFAWIFFRANSLQDALSVVKSIFTLKGSLFVGSPAYLIYSIFGLALLMLVEFKREFYRNNDILFANSTVWARNLSYSLLIIVILLIGVFDGGQFIYFQF